MWIKFHKLKTTLGSGRWIVAVIVGKLERTIALLIFNYERLSSSFLAFEVIG
jgi:hypothetical protein